jgi:hypothetical protein
VTIKCIAGMNKNRKLNIPATKDIKLLFSTVTVGKKA